MNAAGLHIGRRGACITMLALSACVLVMACSQTARYRVLSFVFDGVPPPPGMEPPEAPPAEREERVISAFARGMRTLGEQPRQVAPPVVFASVHEPYAERRCGECHDMDLGLQDLARDARLCDKCHYDQRVEEGWDHGPINLGTCIPCHVSHQSVYEHLLYTPVPDLCLTCHVETTLSVPEYHDVPNFDDCVACHDPHRMY